MKFILLNVRNEALNSLDLNYENCNVSTFRDNVLQSNSIQERKARLLVFLHPCGVFEKATHYYHEMDSQMAHGSKISRPVW